MCDKPSADDQSKKMTEAWRVRQDLEELLHRVDSLPTIDARGAEEILGYDENGVPG